MAHLSKTYGATRALNDVSLEVGRGSIHALLGGNGSGKSTLIKILAGVETADHGGHVRVDGRSVAGHHTSPSFAREVGIHVVHQNPAVFPHMSVADNLAIGRTAGYDTAPFAPIHGRRVRQRTQAVLDRYGIEVRPETPVAALGPGARAMLAIARVLQDQGEDTRGVLILDEPTASLPSAEADQLISTLQRWAAEGQAIMYVTHRLDEVTRMADTVTVLRDGSHVVTRPAAGMTETDLVELIVGRSVEDAFPPAHEVRTDNPLVEVRGLQSGRIQDLSFDVHHGEILGVGGLLGSGRTTLLNTLFGARRPSAGEVRFDGVTMPASGVRGAMRLGIAMVPEDRPGEAAFSGMTVRENLSAASLRRYWRRGRLNHRVESREAQDSIAEFLIRVASDAQPIHTLSGGNQQKVVLARWLRRKPRLILLDEPTQGVDAGARAEIYRMVRAAVDAGASAIVVSSDPEELARVADRVLVIAHGRLSAELTGPSLTAHRIVEASFGTASTQLAERDDPND
ncbi:sugar ABC transporter ATP-binding protein [Nocardioides sp. CPCC 206347]|uniref:sugar ABC transporter ATP-binding protein n=1 Tax=Nocardioides sp. CPCC 206347 TaxID=3406463 RepID=UPI003B42F924